MKQARSIEAQIAQVLRRHRTTPRRELKRNIRANDLEYNCHEANGRAARRRCLSRQSYRFGSEQAQAIITFLERHRPPGAPLHGPLP